MNRSLLLGLLALSLLFVLPACDVGDDDDDTSDDDDSTPDPADTDDDGDGLSENEGDCDDSDAAISPNESEATCDGVDNDCDPGTPDDIDGDADGVLCSTDCDDDDAANFPGNTEICDGSDNDCDGTTWATDEETDDDGDGSLACVDCDDSDGANFPGNAELCDGADNDCNGSDDMGNPGVAGEEADDDGDGQSECQGDCDDADAQNYPSNPELCDGADNDCNGFDDMGNPGVAGEEADDDGDGQSECQGDCDDADAQNYPSNPELCDGADNDCNGLDDMGNPGVAGEEADDDGDGQSECQGDCDDSDGANFPGNAELCDGADNDCNGLDDMGNPGVAGEEADDDGDGQSECQGDCDDSDAMTYPGAPEGLLGSDRDCDGVPGGSGSLSLADASFVGQNADDRSGYSVASAGDVDGDGLGDLLIGANGHDGGGYLAGKTYLFFGSTVAAGGPFGLSLADASFVGETDGDYSGYSVASAGDVDGDGLDDLLIGAYGNNDGGSWAGKTYLFFGSTVSAGGSFDLSTADASFVGENGGDQSGASVASAGDVDGDGLDDLLIGAYLNDEGGIWAGKTYLFFGSTVAAGGPFGLSLADASFVGETDGDYSGYSVASAGDVDGDGLDDLLIGAYLNDDGGYHAGKTYLIFGSTVAAGGSFDLSLADASFVGETAGDRSGVSVASAGDVDGDGLDDLVIGAYWNDDGGLSAGKTYLFFGSTVASGGPFDLSIADASFVGENVADYSGLSVASAGDVDGDGLDDLLIGAYENDDGGTEAGKTYLFFGSTVAAGGTFDLSLADTFFVGENAGDLSGVSVSSAGDVDGDGLDDLLIGAYHNDEGGSDAGKTYLILSHLPTPDYAGLWSVSPSTSYSCALATVALDHLVIDHVTPYATLPGSPELTMFSSSPQPGLLEGGFVTSSTPDSFAVARTESLDSGNCTATWSVIGSYTGIDTLSADFTATFAGSCGGCTNQSFPVTGTR